MPHYNETFQCIWHLVARFIYNAILLLYAHKHTNFNDLHTIHYLVATNFFSRVVVPNSWQLPGFVEASRPVIKSQIVAILHVEGSCLTVVLVWLQLTMGHVLINLKILSNLMQNILPLNHIVILSLYKSPIEQECNYFLNLHSYCNLHSY